MLQRAGDYLRLVAADEDGVGAYEAGILERLRQGDEHVTGDGVDKIAALIHKAALKHAEKIENGQLLNMAAVYRLHIVGGDIPGGEHTVKRAVVVDDLLRIAQDEGADGRADDAGDEHLPDDAQPLEHPRAVRRGAVAQHRAEHGHAGKIAAHHQKRAEKHRDGTAEEIQQHIARHQH